MKRYSSFSGFPSGACASESAGPVGAGSAAAGADSSAEVGGRVAGGAAVCAAAVSEASVRAAERPAEVEGIAARAFFMFMGFFALLNEGGCEYFPDAGRSRAPPRRPRGRHGGGRRRRGARR